MHSIHIETETASAILSVEASPTGESGGATRFTATFENDIFEEQTIVAQDLPALRDLDVLYLPEQLRSIDVEAFQGLACQAVIVPEGCEAISARAFADCPDLLYIRIPASVTQIDPTAFEGSPAVRVDR